MTINKFLLHADIKQRSVTADQNTDEYSNQYREIGLNI